MLKLLQKGENKNMKTFTLPPSEYFIGDCSVVFPSTGNKVHLELMFKCSLGEGLYFDLADQHYVSDSGFLGIVLIEDMVVDKEFLQKVGRIAVFEYPFVVTFSEDDDPTHVFGPIEIFTLNSEQLEEERSLEED